MACALFLLAVWIGPGRAQAPVVNLRLVMITPADSQGRDTAKWSPRLRADSVTQLRYFHTPRHFYFSGSVFLLRDSVEAFLRDGGVLSIAPTGLMIPPHDTLAFGSPLSASSWGVAFVQADKACLTKHVCGQGRQLGVADGGSGPHPDLTIARGFDATGNMTLPNQDFSDDEGCDNHGSHVLGTVAGRRTDAVTMGVGVAPDAQMSVYKIAGPFTWGCILESQALVAAWQDALDHGLDAINCSCSFGEGHGWDAIVASFTRANLVLVIAAGNDGGPVNAPADSPGAWAVCSVGPSGALSGFSSHDSTLTACGPGEGITSTIPPNGYGDKSGTSMVGPHITAIVGLLRQVQPNASPDSLKHELCWHGIPVTGTNVCVPQVANILDSLIAAGAPVAAIDHFDVIAGVPFSGCTPILGGQKYDAFPDVPWILWSLSGRTLCFSGTPPANPAGSLTIRGQ